MIMTYDSYALSGLELNRLRLMLIMHKLSLKAKRNTLIIKSLRK